MSRQVLLVGVELVGTKGWGSSNGGGAEEIHLVQTGNATQALEVVDQNTIDAIVVEAQLPDMTGYRLLDQVFQHNSSVHRYLLIDPGCRNQLCLSASMAHFLFRKPMVPAQMLDAIHLADHLSDWFGPGFATQILSRFRKIPSPPIPYFRALAELNSPEASTDKLAAMLSGQPELSSRMIQMVQSGAFQSPDAVASIRDVVHRLGMETTTSLVLFAHLLHQFDRISPYLFSLDEFCQHALSTARLSRALARAERLPEDAQERAFQAGLLHDVGKLLLSANAPDTYSRIHAENQFGYRSFTDMELESLGMSHAEVGGWLAGVWGLHMDVVHALVFHHDPRRLLKEKWPISSLVYAANILVHQVQQDLPGGRVPQMDESFLLAMGGTDRITDWTRLATNILPSSPRDHHSSIPVAA